jgi:tetratricopeptide (TPR) repeat protein
MERTMAMWSGQPFHILNVLRVLIHVVWFIWMMILRLIRLIYLLYWALLRLLWTLVTWWIRSGALHGLKIPRLVLHLSCLFCMKILLMLSRSRLGKVWIFDTAVKMLELLTDLDSLTVVVLREALDLCPPGHTVRLMFLDSLAGALYARFGQLGELDALTETVELRRQALDLLPTVHPLRSTFANSLAVALQILSKQRGDLESLAEAVELHRQALKLCPQGHPDRADSLNNLAIAFNTQFEQLGDLESLAEAVKLHRQALDLYPQGHPDRSLSLNNLANALQTRFEQLGDLDSVAEAVELHRQTLDLRPQGRPARSSSLNNLANALQTRFEQLGDLDSLAEAVELHREALDLRPQGHPDRSLSLNNLASALHTQFQRLDSISNGFDIDYTPQHRAFVLEEELGLLKEGLRSCADGHPMRMNFLFATEHCMLRTGSYAFDFAEAIRYIMEALQHRASPARQSLRLSIGALRAVENAYQILLRPLGETDIGKYCYDDLVLETYSQTIRLLPGVASFGLDHAGRLRELSGAEAITRNAATRAIAAGRENEAIEMLEEGRGVFWSQALRLRTTDLDLLSVQDAQELRRLFRLLDVRSIVDESTTTPQRERLVEQRRRLSNSAEALISEIRSRPGMGRFLLPPALSSLVQSLPEGFVVFLNVSELGYHALILDGSKKSVQSLLLRLPNRIAGTNRKAVKDKLSNLRDNHDEFPAGDSVRCSLADLWVCIVKPIINLLQLQVCMLARQSSQIFTENPICRSQAVGTDRVSGGAPRTS